MKLFVSSVALFGISSAVQKIDYNKTNKGDTCTWETHEGSYIGNYAKDNGRSHDVKYSNFEFAKLACQMIDAKNAYSKCTGVTKHGSRDEWTLRSGEFIKSSPFGETAYVPNCQSTAEPMVDGQWGDWGAYGDCVDGEKKRERQCNNPPPSGGGAPCSGDATEVIACQETAEDELNGIVGKFKQAFNSAFPQKGKFYDNYAKRVPNIAKRMLKLANKFGCGQDRTRRNAEELLHRMTRSSGAPACDAILQQLYAVQTWNNKNLKTCGPKMPSYAHYKRGLSMFNKLGVLVNIIGRQCPKKLN